MMANALTETFVLIGGAFTAVALLTKLQASPIIGYLAAGLVLGPTGFGLMSGDGEATHFLGELGIALLMFVIGLEFSVPRLRNVGRSIASLAFLVIASITSVFTGIGIIVFELAPASAFVIGGAAAMSSTAIVHKYLIEADEVASSHGLAASGIILLEDIFALMLLAVIPAATVGEGWHSIEAAVAKLTVSVLAFAGVALLARRTLGRLLAWVCRSRVNETFLLAVLTIILGASFAAQTIGLSLPIGAFVVGMVVGESDFRHQLEDEIRPFRDLLVGIFFVTIGMGIDLDHIANAMGTTAILFVGIAAVKLALVYCVGRACGLMRNSAIRAGLLLAHTGELGLLMIERSLDARLIPADLAHPLLGAIALSMLVGPVIAQAAGHLSSRAGRIDDDNAAVTTAGFDRSLRDHVVLAGCGPVGRLVALTLENGKIPYMAVELNVERLWRAQEEGLSVVLGDVTRPGILKSAGIDKAAVLLVLINDRRRSIKIVRCARSIKPDLRVIVSLRDDSHLAELVRAGANHIFPENYASGLGLANQTLISFGKDPADADAEVRAVRAALNPELGLAMP